MDYSSIPWGLRWLVNWSRVDIAGVVHDHIYRKKTEFTWCERWDADVVWFRLARSGVNRANWLQAALGLVGLYLGACWVQPARPKCSKLHKTAMAITGLLVLGLLAYVLAEWQLWLWLLCKLLRLLMMFGIEHFTVLLVVLIAVIGTVNLIQSRT